MMYARKCYKGTILAIDKLQNDKDESDSDIPWAKLQKGCETKKIK